MSLGQHLAENKFWATPELVQKLLQVLDLAAIKELAEVHQLTRDILGGAFFWKKLIRKSFPEINIDFGHKRCPREDDPHFASMRPKAKLLSQIMNMMEDSKRPPYYL